MKRRILAMALASALALSLAACGGGNGGGSASSTPGGSSSVSSSQPDGSAPDGSNPDVSSPDGSQPDASDPDGSASGSAGGSASSAEGLKVTLTLNRTNIELNKAGATFRLRYTAEPDTDGIPTFTSSDTKVATVAEDGTIKAVAPGKATITVTYDGATATASVNCSWKESQPAPTPKPDASKPDSSGSGSSSSSDSSGGSSSSAPAASVNLSDFYTTTTGKYQFSFMMEADDTMLSTFFAGLSNLTLAQQVVYLCGMSPSPHGDFVLVQVSDSKDVDTVKSILQARIDYMVGDGNGPGGAFYPMEQTMWEENARIAVNGDCVMLIVHPDCDSIVDDFNALF
ncbi:MAG: DUF4358 domain-containing protein [Lawsonibacter sp.]|jgi:hypothetical protein|nr:DUF4358 domain-containing protein [Lawsonibacter sp.]MCI8990831.1 DUF4358 domain-containing protein [Lawsonibacter sp.]MCI9267388.1 DUF4358 domain-containing protein [Lawsonibacter sp.]